MNISSRAVGEEPFLRGPGPSRAAVLAFHEGGVETAVLTPGEAVVIGRGPQASLRVPSDGISRAHARITLLSGDARVRVDDLGSTNGTWVRGGRIDTAEIGPGEEVVLGDVRVRVQTLGPANESPTNEELVAGAAMREVLDTAMRVAGSTIPVVLLGETGTGKEVVARLIHTQSHRRSKPLVSVNCAAIPRELVESTFFGHERGAFTGATEQRRGLFEEAHGGTIFLDEIGELPPPAQAALLRVLETGRFSRVGASREIAVDVRVVAATHRDLEAMGQTGQFRPDLYYRLSTMTIPIPALRERPEDIPALADLFLRRSAFASGRPVRGIAEEAMEQLLAYDFPGNVRELRNAIERAVVVASGELVQLADLPHKLRSSARVSLPPVSSIPMGRATIPALPPLEMPTGQGDDDFRARMADYERRLLVDALNRAGWNQTKVAKDLNIPVRTLSYKLRALGIKRPEK